MGDGAAERRLGRADRIDMDELVVAGRLGERSIIAWVTSTQSETCSVPMLSFICAGVTVAMARPVVGRWTARAPSRTSFAGTASLGAPFIQFRRVS